MSASPPSLKRRRVDEVDDRSPLGVFAAEVWVHIFAHLDPKRDLLCSLRRASRALYDLVDAEVVTYRISTFATSKCLSATPDPNASFHTDEDTGEARPDEPLAVREVQAVASARSYHDPPSYAPPDTYAVLDPETLERRDMLFLPCRKLATLSAPELIPWAEMEDYLVTIERSDWPREQAVMLWKREELDRDESVIVYFNVDVPEGCSEIVGFNATCSRGVCIRGRRPRKLELFRRPRHIDEAKWAHGTDPRFE